MCTVKEEQRAQSPLIYLQLVLELPRLDAKDLLGRPAILFELHLQRVHDRLLFAQQLLVVLELRGLETLQLLGGSQRHA